MRTKGGVLVVVMGSLIMGAFSMAFAQSNYPDRPIDLVIGYQPGGAMDFIQAIYKDRVNKILGQPIVSVFKAGAGGAIAAAYVAKAKPDGYTLYFGSNATMVFIPLTKKDNGYTPDELTPVCNLTLSPNLLCVKDDSPYKTLRDFIQAAKTKKLKYATYGVNSGPHILMEALGRAAGFKATHIPYPGAGPAYVACLGGHVDMAISTGTGGMVGPQKLRILAVTSEQRYDLQPDIPTLKELGYNIVVPVMFYLWAPKNTSLENIKKISDAYKKATDEGREEIRKGLVNIEQSLYFLDTAQVRKAAQVEYQTMKKMVEELGMLAK